MQHAKLPHDNEENETRIPVPQQLIVALGILVLVFGTTYIGEISARISPPEEKPVVTPQKAEVTEELPEATQVDPFEDAAVTARSAYVWDVREQRALFNKNADEQLPIASITKLMTALVAYEVLETDSVVNITAGAIRQDGDSGLSSGDQFTLQDITDFTLLTSSNDGAYALAANAGSLLTERKGPAETFVRAMNIRAEEMGLAQTYFKNPTGLDISEEEAGAYGSARDVAFLLEYIISEHPNITELTSSEHRSIMNEAGERYDAENTNQTIYDLPNLIASKTGYTDLAGGNLVIAFNAGLNRPIIVSVLGSTFYDRFTDAAELAELAQEFISNDN